jgi:hypothetical protein
MSDEIGRVQGSMAIDESKCQKCLWWFWRQDSQSEKIGTEYSGWALRIQYAEATQAVFVISR